MNSSGDVGIGTDSPEETLDVDGTSLFRDNVFMEWSSGGSTNFSPAIIGLNGAGNGYIIKDGTGTGSLVFKVGNPATEKLRLTSDSVWANALYVTTGGVRVTSLASIDEGICTDGSGDFEECGASLKDIKRNISTYSRGLEVVAKLRPVQYEYKEDGRKDIGFLAEEVATVEPRLSTEDSKGELYGVKYTRISAALVSAVQAQQRQIDELTARLEMLDSSGACSFEETKSRF